MADMLAAAAFLILAITLLALLRVLRSRVLAERMMALQLLGTGGTAVLLLLGAASGSACRDRCRVAARPVRGVLPAWPSRSARPSRPPNADPAKEQP